MVGTRYERSSIDITTTAKNYSGFISELLVAHVVSGCDIGMLIFHRERYNYTSSQGKLQFQSPIIKCNESMRKKSRPLFPATEFPILITNDLDILLFSHGTK